MLCKRACPGHNKLLAVHSALEEERLIVVDNGLYAQPRDVTSTEACLFYHTMDIPGHGLVTGMWDLRPNVNKYLGQIELQGKRVLEIGTASGYLCFHMESQGAEVVAFDLSPTDKADIVPFARADVEKRYSDMTPWLDRIRNGFWLAHKAHDSRSKVVYGNVYAIPRGIGPVDVSTFGSILLHLRDPFLALQNALALTRETVVVTEPIWSWFNFLRFFSPSKRFGGQLIFLPDAALMEPSTTWWYMSPMAIRRFVSVLGFEQSRVLYHFQRHVETGKRVLCYTVVGRRTVPLRNEE